ncbi:MAG: malate synthase A, partial [Desulfobacterales bacterium]
MNTQNAVAGIEVTGPVSAEFSQILTPEALAFVGGLARKFDTRRKELLDRRQQVQADINAGKRPDFLPETRPIREGDWKIEPVPDDLKNRRTEITGPVDRKMVINALNSGASTYMADFEDSHAPTWDGTIQGQINLRDAVAGSIEFRSPEGKSYRLADRIATLIVRPR